MIGKDVPDGSNTWEPLWGEHIPIECLDYCRCTPEGARHRVVDLCNCTKTYRCACHVGVVDSLRTTYPIGDLVGHFKNERG